MNDRFSEELFLTNETGKMLYHPLAETLQGRDGPPEA